MTISKGIAWQRLGAESVVIVVSILLALGMDEWRVSAQEREIETEYLARLLGDLEADLAVIEEQSRGEWDGLDTATAVRSSYLATPSPTPQWVDGTFKELQSTGRMAFIRSSNIRAEVLAYYHFLGARDYTYELMSTTYRDAVRERMDPDLQLRLRAECRPREATCPVDVTSPELDTYVGWLVSNENLAQGLRRVIVQWTRGEQEFLPSVKERTKALKARVEAEIADR